MQCPDCDFSHADLKRLSIHYRWAHSKKADELAVHLFHGGQRPTCKCGCGEAVRFFGIVQGFGEWRRGHISRVQNNWGHNPTALEKSHSTTRARYRSGDLKIWNAGLTKEAHPSIVAYGQSNKQSWTIDKRSAYSKRLSENRLNGIVPTLSGSAHSQWKGGTSTLGAMCGADKRLYEQWKYPKLAAAGFQCVCCSSSDNLQVHHDQIRMAEIIHTARWSLVADDRELTFEEKKQVVDAVVDFHLQNDVSGLVLCHRCHEAEHPSLNF